jgi:hypothetical protein
VARPNIFNNVVLFKGVAIAGIIGVSVVAFFPRGRVFESVSISIFDGKTKINYLKKNT